MLTSRELSARFSKAACLILLVLCAAGCGENSIVKKTKPVMGTWATIKIHDEHRSAEALEDLLDNAFTRMEEIDRLMSSYRDESDIGKINNSAPGEKIKISTETLMVLKRCQKLYSSTGGAFDITVLPLVKLWGFYKETIDAIPSEDRISETLKLVGQDKLSVDGEFGYISLSEDGMGVDLSGIAKGFAVDEAVTALRRKGIDNAMVDAGGDIYCLGSAPDEEPWKIGIKHPRKDKIITTLELKDAAVATSGDYENFNVIDCVRYSHIIDPRTGSPAKNAPLSVTVLAMNCAEADGLATAISVLGAEEGISLINGIDSAEAIIISEDSESLKVDLSEGMKDLLYEFDK